LPTVVITNLIQSNSDLACQYIFHIDLLIRAKMRLHSSLSSGAYVKRKGTPLGTLTSKKIESFNFSRNSNNSFHDISYNEDQNSSIKFDQYSAPPSTSHSYISDN